MKSDVRSMVIDVHDTSYGDSDKRLGRIIASSMLQIAGTSEGACPSGI